MNLLSFVLELYRLAQEVPANEFPDLALEMLKATVGFRSATWSNADVTDRGVEIRSVHLHEEPTELRVQFSSFNQKHTRRLLPLIRNPGHAHVINDTVEYFNRVDEAPMRAYLKRYEHERNMLIRHGSEWVSLYRPRADEPFSEKHVAIVDLLMPHLIEALSINRAVTLGDAIAEGSLRPTEGRALIDHNGAFLHCGKQFMELLRSQWRDWSEPRVPTDLLPELSPHRPAKIAGGTVEISATACADALLLLARRVSPLARLSPRELEVARQFGVGKSYKAIALDVQLAPATVRNVLQKAYRKLQIDNKADLARLLALNSEQS